MKLNALVGSRYRLTRRIGPGGMGEVWEALDTILQRPVAVKFLDPARLPEEPDLLPLFAAEAINGAKLGFHPCIAPTLDSGKQTFNGIGLCQYIVQEFVSGATLQQWIDQVNIYLEEDVTSLLVFYIGHQIACALEHAHKLGVVHRDIKPSNILLSRLGSVKVVDFGLSKDLSEPTRPHTARAGGTLAYMSPEQFRGQRSSKKTDMYQFGATMYHAFAFATPFEGSHADIVSQHLNDPAPSFATVVEVLGSDTLELLDRTLSKDPGQRPGALTVRKALLDEIDLPGAIVVDLSAAEPDARAAFFDIARVKPTSRPAQNIRVRFKVSTDLLQVCLALTAHGITTFELDYS